MARPIRIEFPDAVYHIMARGNERQAIFRDDQDRVSWLDAVAQMHEQFDLRVHAFVLMSNHYHLIVETPRANLSQALGWLQTTYAIRFNRRHDRVGHLYQGRFKAQLVDANEYATALIRYVHLNPVRTRDRSATLPTDRVKKLSEYEWSSHLDYAGKRESAEWLDLSWLRYWGRSKREAYKAYRRDMESLFGKPIPSPWDDLRGGLVLGGTHLWEQVRYLMGDKKGDEEIRWREGVSAEELKQRVRSLVEDESDRRIQIWARVRLGGERKVDVAKDFGHRDGSGVMQVVKRLEFSAQQDKILAGKLQKLKRTLSSVKS